MQRPEQRRDTQKIEHEHVQNRHEEGAFFSVFFNAVKSAKMFHCLLRKKVDGTN